MSKLLAKAGTVAHSRVEMTQVVMPQHTNPLGTMFGGELLSWIDICASICAQRHCRGPVVTVSFDEVHFVTPIKHGFVVELHAQVNAVFSSSMEIGITATAENPLNGDRNVAVRAFASFVFLDENGKPKACPPLLDLSPEEKIREHEAQERRKVRLMHRQAEKKQAS